MNYTEMIKGQWYKSNYARSVFQFDYYNSEENTYYYTRGFLDGAIKYSGKISNAHFFDFSPASEKEVLEYFPKVKINIIYEIY